MLERAKRASHIDPPASSYAIMRRARPYRGENHGPGKDVQGELDLTPGIREQPGSLADISSSSTDVRFSNRPVGVKHFQAIQHCSVDVSHGLALLFGIGTKALPLWDPRTRWNNLYRGLAVSRTVGPSGHTNSPHPSSREGQLSTASSFLLSDLIVHDVMLLAQLAPGTTGTRCRRPRCGA